MARPAIPRAKEVILTPEPPKKKKNLEQVIPDPTKRAAKHIGYDKLMGSGKGHNKGAHEKAYSSLYKLLDHRQRVLIMQMKAKNKKIKKRENPEPAYVDPRPNGDYLVERILNSRRRKGSLQYQMLWEGFPLEMASWEPIRLIDGDISTLVENFYKEFPGKPGDPAKGHNEYLDQLEEEKKAEAEKNTHGDADPEAELTVEATLRPMAKKTKTADADTEVESDAEACAGANTAVIAEDDEDDIPVSAVGDRGPKSRKAKKTRLFDANRPVNVGDAAAQAMKLIPASPRNKKKAAAAIPATRKSSRNATQKYGSLDDKALTQGKVKPSPNGLSSYSTSNDDDDEEIRVPRPAYPAGLVSMASLIADPGVTAGRSVQTAADLFSNASDDEQEVEVSQNPFRNNRGTKRAHDGKEKSANKKPRDDSDSSDYDLTTCPVAANSPVQVRKKAKMTSTRERKAQEITAGKKVARSHMDDLFGEALEERSDGGSESEKSEEE